MFVELDSVEIVCSNPAGPCDPVGLEGILIAKGGRFPRFPSEG
jgi:hypothetical protein